AQEASLDPEVEPIEQARGPQRFLRDQRHAQGDDQQSRTGQHEHQGAGKHHQRSQAGCDEHPQATARPGAGAPVVSTLEALAGGDGAKAAPGAAEDFEATDGGDSGRGAEKDSHTPRMNVGLASPGRHRDHRRQRNGGPRSLLEAFGLILAMLVAGRALAWRGLVPADAAATLNLVVLYVCLPAAVLLHAPHLRFERVLVGVVAVPWLILLASCALTLL